MAPLLVYHSGQLHLLHTLITGMIVVSIILFLLMMWAVRKATRMAEKQHSLVQELEEKEWSIKNMELSLLQSQINPHFLSNTFETIYWMAKEHEMDEISEMVLHLSKFFRYSLCKGAETLRLEEVLANLNHYIRIQQIRFMDRFSYALHIDERTKDIQVLKVILQPLVENAFIHGLERQTENGHLSIRTSIESKFLRIEIEDNGKGMTTERLSFVQQELDRLHLGNIQSIGQENNKTKGFFGLRNVKSRLLLYYGQNAALQIESTEDSGTLVTIHIPIDGMRAY